MAWLTLKLRGMNIQHECSVNEGTKHHIICTAPLSFLFSGSQCYIYNSLSLLNTLGAVWGNSILSVDNILLCSDSAKLNQIPQQSKFPNLKMTGISPCILPFIFKICCTVMTQAASLYEMYLWQTVNGEKPASWRKVF